MKIVLGWMLGIVGLATLSGCSGQVGDAERGETVVTAQSEALIVTNTALSRGTRKDYDGDGKEDVIFMNPGDPWPGSYQYLGAAPSGWTTDGWIRTDLLIDNSSYVAGDFNGDHKTDLLITTAGGTYEYTGNAGGGFNGDVWISGAFVLDQVKFTIGDFNGDGNSDFIATTSTGSYLYTGKATGGFNANVWSNSALKLGVVAFTPGNFNLDAPTDFIVTSANGSYEYTGKSTGGFNANVWTDSTLTNGGANVSRFIVGDFNGDSKDDFIVQKQAGPEDHPEYGGAFLYTGNSTSGFNANVWNEPSYTITGPIITPGDYDGDGVSEFLVQEGNLVIQRVWIGFEFSSSIWADGTFGNPYNATLTRGDFNGDGRDDFLAATLSTIGDGTSENTGNPGGGFNMGVWANPYAFKDTQVIF